MTCFGEGRDTSPFDEHDGHEGFQSNGTSQQLRINGGLTLPLSEPENLHDLNFPEHDDDMNNDPSVPEATILFEDLVKERTQGMRKEAFCDGTPSCRRWRNTSRRSNPSRHQRP